MTIQLFLHTQTLDWKPSDWSNTLKCQAVYQQQRLCLCFSATEAENASVYLKKKGRKKPSPSSMLGPVAVGVNSSFCHWCQWELNLALFLILFMPRPLALQENT